MSENIKYSGIHFKVHDDAGIAKINITNTTTSTGIVTNDLVDLYHPDFDDTTNEYGDFIYWTKLDPATDDYLVEVEHSGSHNASATGPNYAVEILDLYMNEELIDGSISAVLTTWHTTYESHTYTYTLSTNAVTDLSKTITYNGDDTTTVFTLPVTIHAASFVEYSIDGGTTWNYPTSVNIDWGSNATDYDDETINASGNFSVKFTTAPTTGTGNVQIKYVPLVNTYTIKRTINQPGDGISFVDRVSQVRLLDDGLELIKES